MTDYKEGDRVIVNTKNVVNKKGTLGAGRNGNFYLGKLDDGRSFQAKAEHLTPVSPATKEVQACRSALYLAASNAMPETTAKLLSYIVCQGPTRTDALGQYIGATPAETAPLLMALVRQGFIGYTARRSAAEYALWYLTEPYKEHLRDRTGVKPERNRVQVEEYVLWCPTSQLPPSVTYPTLAKAKEVATIMAKRHPGQEFKICGVVGSAQVVTEQVTTEVTTLKVTGV